MDSSQLLLASSRTGIANLFLRSGKKCCLEFMKYKHPIFTFPRDNGQKLACIAAFGPSGEHHLRLAYCVDEDTTNLASDRIENYFQGT